MKQPIIPNLKNCPPLAIKFIYKRICDIVEFTNKEQTDKKPAWSVCVKGGCWYKAINKPRIKRMLNNERVQFKNQNAEQSKHYIWYQ